MLKKLQDKNTTLPVFVQNLSQFNALFTLQELDVHCISLCDVSRHFYRIR